ncbi:transport protein [Salmonella enterica subsp. enterica]|uniref:Transport protein n=1 Tax=Salmonella enterica I TaxID=59201 RepID=A0A447U6C1_SALET|nr:transport protein [Salmonella enterica subsp. enterica]
MLMQNYSDNLLFIMIASVSFIYLLMLLRNAGQTPNPVRPHLDCSLNRMQDVSLAYSLFMFYVK